MGNVGWNRRIAAIATLLVLVLTLLVSLRWIARNGLELLVLLVGLSLVAAGAWWIATEVGVVRYGAIASMVVGAVLVVVAVSWSISTARHVVLWVSVLVAVMVAPILLAQYALRRPVPKVRVGDERRRPSRPVLLCNPWSGGGKVDEFGLVDLAAEMGVETVLLAEGLDLEQLTRDAVDRGADCLGMAGGDGSQALVASVAIEHDLPYVCIPAGTRNHLALDLGLDRDDPRAAMRAFHDVVERRVDLATVNDRVFVNNVSLGIYATIVQSPEYRESKAEVSRSMIQQLLAPDSEGFDLQYTSASGNEVDGAFVIQVSNNPYVLGARLDAAQRRAMDSGRLGVFGISTTTATQAGRLVSLAVMGVPDVSKYWHEFTADTFEVRSRSGTAFVGVDGEALEMETPLRFRSLPGALRLYVPDGNLDVAERRRARSLGLADVVSVAMGREPRAVVS